MSLVWNLVFPKSQTNVIQARWQQAEKQNFNSINQRNKLKKKVFIEKLLIKLNAKFEPEIVPLKLEEYSKEKNCFFNVPKKVKIDGGKIHYGWILHENEFFYEAERHAVWENDNEDLIDITPSQKENTEKIMFLSDNNFQYKGQYIGNIRVNSTKNKIVEDYIFILEKIDFVKSIFVKKNENDIHFPDEIKNLIKTLNDQANSYYTFIKVHNGTDRTKCFCGQSDKNYKNCHGKIMKKEVNEFVKQRTKAYC